MKGVSVLTGAMNTPLARLEQMVHVVRGRRVMLDEDLARIYGVSTRRLNEQVKRNLRRFPPDFMFPLTRQERENLMSQIATSSLKWGGRRKAARAFTQEGVAMLSSVLRSGRAVKANVAIMRAFVRHQETLALNRDLARKFKELEGRVDRHDGEIGAILDAIRGLIEGPPSSEGRIGFKPS